MLKITYTFFNFHLHYTHFEKKLCGVNNFKLQWINSQYAAQSISEILCFCNIQGWASRLSTTCHSAVSSFIPIKFHTWKIFPTTWLKLHVTLWLFLQCTQLSHFLSVFSVQLFWKRIFGDKFNIFLWHDTLPWHHPINSVKALKKKLFVTLTHEST